MFDADWIAAPKHRSPVPPSQPGDGDVTIRNGLAYIGRIKAVSGSGGHNATFRAACKLRDAGMTAAEAFEAMLDWNETNASPPWSPNELAHKVDDAYRSS